MDEFVEAGVQVECFVQSKGEFTHRLIVPMPSLTGQLIPMMRHRSNGYRVFRNTPASIVSLLTAIRPGDDPTAGRGVLTISWRWVLY